MKKIMAGISLIFFCSGSLVLASARSAEDQKVEDLRKKYEGARTDYRAALIAQVDSKNAELKQKEEALASENDKSRREKMIGEAKDLRKQKEELNEKVRAINATDVVKFSDRKHKFAALFTHTK